MGVDQGMQLIVRNTFLEFSEDEEPRWQPLAAEQPWSSLRRRSISDLTDTKLPVKFELPTNEGVFEVARHRLSSNLDDNVQSCAGCSGSNADRPRGCLPTLPEEACSPFAGCDMGQSPSGFGGYASLLMPVDGPVPRSCDPGNLSLDAALHSPAAHAVQASGPADVPQGGKIRLQLFDCLETTCSRDRRMSFQNAAHQNGDAGAAAAAAAAATVVARAAAVAAVSSSMPEPPAAVASVMEAASRSDTVPPTTVMLRNIPNAYTREMLKDLLDAHGFRGCYDFLYLPVDFRNRVNLGYAFVNLLSHSEALRLTFALHGFASWLTGSSKVCEVSWSHPIQGLADHVERYRNSPVMHSSMPEEYKPMLFSSGIRVPFPPPTKPIKAPKKRLTARETQGQA